MPAIFSLLRKHPVVCLLLLTPGIPEYLSSSSPLNAIVLNPPMFIVQLAANLGLYGPGVLLIREAKIRWKKGWGSVLALGAAYGVLEEGVALSTLFNPTAGPVGSLGTYGHWVGVNWVWLAGIVPFHMIFSISIPILFLGIALPETRGVQFLGGRKLVAAFGVLSLDVLGLFLLITLGVKFWMGTPVLVGSFAAIAVLVLLAWRAPDHALRARPGLPGRGPRSMALLGVAFYPAVLLSEGAGEAAGVPASIDFVLVILLQGLFLFYFLREVGTVRDERVLVATMVGLVVPIAAIGVIAEAGLPFTLAGDAAFVMFVRKLWRRPLDEGVPPLAPVGA